MEPLPVISLFSGVGGLDMAVEKCAEPPLVQDRTPGPYRIAVATDYDRKALEVLRLNFRSTPTICGDIRSISSAELMDAAGNGLGEAGLVIGGPPCTPFSKSGFWLEEKRESRDPDASLLDEFVRVVGECQPQGFVLENVQALTYRTHATRFSRLLRGLEDVGYSVGFKVLIAADFGVPQLRRRVFVIGRRDRGLLMMPQPTHSGWSERDKSVDLSRLPYVTAKEAIGDLLPGIPEDGEIAEGTFGQHLAEVPAGENYLWHTERGGGRNMWKWRSRYWTFLLKLDPDRPASTIQAQPGPWVGPFHWDNVDTPSAPRARRLRIPEMKRLMTFPDSFEIDGRRADVQRQLGNAVPVELGKAVTRSLAISLGHLASDQHGVVLPDQLVLV
ncbi:MAG: DNA cytosine methyltransferase [Acidimicrobiaceae bacterium]|nr:DNA cytosine methyltransferase [Acidimicrobiaceae bacterium]